MSLLTEIIKARSRLSARGFHPDVLEIARPFQLPTGDLLTGEGGQFLLGMTVRKAEKFRVGGCRRAGKYEVVPRMWETVN